MDCNKLKNGTIYGLYCGRVKVDPETGEEVEVTAENDDYCRYFHEHDVTKRPGIPGLASGVFLSKFFVAKFCRSRHVYIHCHLPCNVEW